MNAEGNDEEVFIVHSTKLVEIINSCGLKIKNKVDIDESINKLFLYEFLLIVKGCLIFISID